MIGFLFCSFDEHCVSGAQALLSGNKSVIVESLLHINILYDKEQSVVYSCLVEILSN